MDALTFLCLVACLAWPGEFASTNRLQLSVDSGSADSQIVVTLRNPSKRSLSVSPPVPGLTINLWPPIPSKDGFSRVIGNPAVTSKRLYKIPPGNGAERFKVDLRELVATEHPKEGRYSCRLIYNDAFVNSRLWYSRKQFRDFVRHTPIAREMYKRGTLKYDPVRSMAGRLESLPFSVLVDGHGAHFVPVPPPLELQRHRK
jgi:hypothetical protein